MKRAVCLIVVAVVGCERHRPATPPPPAPVAEAPINGRTVFLTHCATCHGEKGDGNGPAAEFLFPRPRNFTGGVYKIRSTRGLPSDEDIFRTITVGIPGSAMPSFEFIKTEERRALVGYLKDLAAYYDEDDEETFDRFKEAGERRPIKIPKPPERTEALVQLGRQTYKRLLCASCHGENGKGDGPSAPSLRDRWDYPTRPADLRTGVFKGGDSVSDIYLRFETGMPGTPMPSFSGSASERELWALAYYVKSVAHEKTKPLTQLSKSKIRGIRASGSIPMNPIAKVWANAPSTEIPLMALWQRSKVPRRMTIRVLYSDAHVGLLLEWPDDTVDGAAVGQKEFTDAAAAMFSLTNPPGFITMGSKDKPVNMWQWRFRRQLDMAQFRDIELTFPRLVVDGYPNGGPRNQGPHAAPAHDPTFLSGWGAGNALSNPTPSSAVQDLNAEGFGTLASQPAAHQDVEGRGVWSGGRWKLVLRRPLKGSGQDAKFSPGKTIHVAFAFWNGSAGDRDGIKSITFWQLLTLE